MITIPTAPAVYTRRAGADFSRPGVDGAGQAEAAIRPTQEQQAMREPFPYISEREAAMFLGVHVNTLRAWRRAGTGPPAYAVGSRYRYHLDELHAWVRANAQAVRHD